MENQALISSFETMALFRPPIVRWAGAALDRSLFSKTIPIAAARISDIKNITRYRNELVQTKEILKLERLAAIRPDTKTPTTKVILLNPKVKPEDQTTWSKSLQEGVDKEEIGVIPYELKLDYDYWNYLEIVKSILPEDEQGEIPQGFSMVGHVAHMNLREEYLPYKNILAEVLMDKNPGVRTIINKIDGVGEHSEFRTFKYEVLHGPDDLNVEVSEGDCTFQFDYSKVYWNPRLETEHKRLKDLFQKGDVVVDVMAGVGPFAVPAGKKEVFVWANDLNPESNKSLKYAIKRNKVENYVRAFCEDGHTFIRTATDSILNNDIIIRVPSKVKRPLPPGQKSPSHRTKVSQTDVHVIEHPRTINHFVMNLPASAINFLGSFNTIYAGHEDLFEPHTSVKLPMVHVHCFSTKVDNPAESERDVSQRITDVLGAKISPDDKDFILKDVRDVAPNKKMFCASFRIPAEVAFRKRE